MVKRPHNFKAGKRGAHTPQRLKERANPTNTINHRIASYDVIQNGAKFALRGPTDDVCRELTHAYDFFNAELFDGDLPPCLITLQRYSRAYGYFSGKRFVDKARGRVTDELALHPTMIASRVIDKTLSTMVHEQAHIWQFHFSAYDSRRGVMRAYHDLEWGDKMESIGLMPSNTGEPGGKKTGRQMTHYIISNGAFDKACKKLLETGFQITWQENLSELRRRGKGRANKTPDLSKVRFTCPVCKSNAWARHTARLVCGEYKCGGPRMTAI